MIKISHEFPLCFYENGFAEANTDYDYILAHRYVSNPPYREYALNAVKKGREVILDNSLYELRESFSGEMYANIIRELKPTYYMLPDVFDTYEENLHSQYNFYMQYGKELLNLGSTAVGIIHAKDIYGLTSSFYSLNVFLEKECPIAIPFGSSALLSSDLSSRYDRMPKAYVDKSIEYEPVRMAINRMIFLKENYEMIKESGRKIHLLGLKSLAEFTMYAERFRDSGDKSVYDLITSIDTSLPVTFSLENSKMVGPRYRGEHGYWKFSDVRKRVMHAESFISDVRWDGNEPVSHGWWEIQWQKNYPNGNIQDMYFKKYGGGREGLPTNTNLFSISVREYTLESLEHYYKPLFLIDKHFEDKFEVTSILKDNIAFFRDYVTQII